VVDAVVSGVEVLGGGGGVDCVVVCSVLVEVLVLGCVSVVVEVLVEVLVDVLVLVDVEVLVDVDVEVLVDVVPWHCWFPLSEPPLPPPWFWSQLPWPPPFGTQFPLPSSCVPGEHVLAGAPGLSCCCDGAASAIAATTPAAIIAARSAIRNVFRR
jgi:hypothetical protein